MYWIIALLWCIGGTAVFWAILSAKWNKLGTFGAMWVSTTRILFPFAPGEPNYMDLKFTLLRHAVVTLVSAILIYAVNANSLNSIILTLNVFYVITTVRRYSYRKRCLREIPCDEDAKDGIEKLSALIQDSLCAVIYAAVCVVVLFILYAIRPY